MLVRRRLSLLLATAMMLVMMLATASPALADPSEGNGFGQFFGVGNITLDPLGRHSAVVETPAIL